MSSVFRPECHTEFVQWVADRLSENCALPPQGATLADSSALSAIDSLTAQLGRVFNVIDTNGLSTTRGSQGGGAARGGRAPSRPAKRARRGLHTGAQQFFDPRDRVQVKYEMLRRHRVDGRAVSHVAEAFGISRQAYYVAEQDFQQQGIPGLLPRPRGPRRNHKCTEEVLDFAERWQAGEERGRETLTQAVRRHFGITVHPRSLDRALARRKKKLTTTRPSG